MLPSQFIDTKMTYQEKVKSIYTTLLDFYGQQQWWPADSPFEVIVGAVLTQNTAWVNVERAIQNLKKADALSPEVILATHSKRLATWLKPSGYFNVKAKRLKNVCRWLLDRGGFDSLNRLDTITLRNELLTVHGVGKETADDILLYGFDRPIFVIDAYTRRIFTRLALIRGEEDYEQLRTFMERSLKASRNKISVFNEYHALIVRHAKEHCRVKPVCSGCVLVNDCQQSGI